jgi:hypothetical protein
MMADTRVDEHLAGYMWRHYGSDHASRFRSAVYGSDPKFGYHLRFFRAGHPVQAIADPTL